MIVLGDPREQQAQMYYRGFLNSLSLLAQQKMKEDLMNKQFQNQLKRLDKLYDLQTQKAKDLAKYKFNLENEQRKRLVRELLGQQQAQVENLNQSFDVGNIRQDILTGIDRAKQQGFDLFGGEAGLLNQAVKNMPQLNLPKPDVKTKYKGGVLSEYANQNPLIADSIKAQVYGVRLPEIKKKETTFVMSDPIKTVDEKGNPIWKIAKMNKATGEVQYETIPMAREYKKGSIKVSESKPFIGEDGKVYFYREYLLPNGEIKRRKLRYYDSKDSKDNRGKGKSGTKSDGITLSAKQLIQVLDQFSKKTSVDMFGNTIELPRNATYQDLKKAFAGKDIYITTKDGSKYKVIGIIDNKPLININGQAFRVVTERNGEPAVEINVNGKVIVAPISKIEKLKQRYQLNSTVQDFAYTPQVGYKTAEEYLLKFGSK